MGNDGQANQLFKNLGTGGAAFELVTTTPIDDATDSTFALAWGDFNGDHLVDLIVGNGAQANQLFQNRGGGDFFQRTDTTVDDASDSDYTRALAWADCASKSADSVVELAREPHIHTVCASKHPMSTD